MRYEKCAVIPQPRYMAILGLPDILFSVYIADHVAERLRTRTFSQNAMSTDAFMEQKLKKQRFILVMKSETATFINSFHIYTYSRKHLFFSIKDSFQW